MDHGRLSCIHVHVKNGLERALHFAGVTFSLELMLELIEIKSNSTRGKVDLLIIYFVLLKKSIDRSKKIVQNATVNCKKGSYHKRSDLKASSCCNTNG